MSHREQFIWKRVIELSVLCYQLTQDFPKSELYGLTSQIRQAAVFVPSNIAEGQSEGRGRDCVVPASNLHQP